MLGCWNRSYTINAHPCGEWEGARSVNKHPLFSLQRVLEPIMCGKSLWMCPAVQDSAPSGPHLKEGRDLQTERWTPQYWGSHVWIIQHSAETEEMILCKSKTYSVNKWIVSSVSVAYTFNYDTGTKLCSHSHILGSRPWQSDTSCLLYLLVYLPIQYGQKMWLVIQWFCHSQTQHLQIQFAGVDLKVLFITIRC